MKRGKLSFRLLLGFIAAALIAGGTLCSAQAQTYFSDDFESGLGNWEVSGYDWAVTESDSHSITHAATDSPDGN